MKIRVTWHRPDGTQPEIETVVSPTDPNRDDQDLQIAKAKAAAKAHFGNRFGEEPPIEQLFTLVTD